MKITSEILVCDICNEARGIEGQREVKKCIVCGKDVCLNCSVQIRVNCIINDKDIINFGYINPLRACDKIHSSKDIVLFLIKKLEEEIK